MLLTPWSRTAIATIAVLVFALTLVGCGSEEAESDESAPDSTVTVPLRDLAFAPANVSMMSGDEVRLQARERRRPRA